MGLVIAWKKGSEKGLGSNGTYLTRKAGQDLPYQKAVRRIRCQKKGSGSFPRVGSGPAAWFEFHGDNEPDPVLKRGQVHFPA